MGNMGSVMKQSFWMPAPVLTEKNLPDQTSRVYIVTGSNTGVGKDLASILYGKNATVYVAARTESKSQDAISQIKSTYPESKGKIHFLKLDLSDLPTIKKSAETFTAAEKRLDGLINNAGVMDPPKGSRTALGHELQYSTNILGPFLFTKLLLPVLRSTAALPDTAKDSVRVCWAASSAVDLLSPKSGGIKFKDLDGSGRFEPDDFGATVPTSAYGVSKAANVFLGAEFGRRYGDKDRVLHNSFNPGNLASDLQRHSSEKYPSFLLWGLKAIMLYPSVYGAYTELYCACSPDFHLPADQGGYVWPWGRKGGMRADVEREVEIAKGRAAGDEKGGLGVGKKLWEWCERETEQYA